MSFFPFHLFFRDSSFVIEKFSEDGGNDRVKYGLSSMQGWRATMEDAVSIPVAATYFSYIFCDEICGMNNLLAFI